MRRVGQSHKGELFPVPVSADGGGILRTNHHNLRVSLDELLVILAQLRQMRAAVGSHQTAVENQHHVLLSPKIRE